MALRNVQAQAIIQNLGTRPDHHLQVILIRLKLHKTHLITKLTNLVKEEPVAVPNLTRTSFMERQSVNNTSRVIAHKLLCHIRCTSSRFMGRTHHLQLLIQLRRKSSWICKKNPLIAQEKAVWLINKKRPRWSRTKNKKQLHPRNLVATTIMISIIKIPARDNNNNSSIIITPQAALTELPLLIVKISSVWLILATVAILTIQLQLKCVPVVVLITRVHPRPCSQINSHQLILRIKERGHLSISRGRSRRCRRRRGIVQQIVVHTHNSWLQLRLISNKCTRRHRLLQQRVRRRCVRVLKMCSNRETSLKFRLSASTHTTSNPVQFTSMAPSQQNYPQTLSNLSSKRKWWWWINKVLKWILTQAQFTPSNRQLHIKLQH